MWHRFLGKEAGSRPAFYFSKEVIGGWTDPARGGVFGGKLCEEVETQQTPVTFIIGMQLTKLEKSFRRKNMPGIGAMDRKPESLSGFPGINQ